MLLAIKKAIFVQFPILGPKNSNKLAHKSFYATNSSKINAKLKTEKDVSVQIGGNYINNNFQRKNYTDKTQRNNSYNVIRNSKRNNNNFYHKLKLTPYQILLNNSIKHKEMINLKKKYSPIKDNCYNDKHFCFGTNNNNNNINKIIITTSDLGKSIFLRKSFFKKIIQNQSNNNIKPKTNLNNSQLPKLKLDIKKLIKAETQSQRKLFSKTGEEVYYFQDD